MLAIVVPPPYTFPLPFKRIGPLRPYIRTHFDG
jgi:hypothetical protein